MWKLDYKESGMLKNWCSWTVLLEKTLESLLDCKEIQPVHPKGDQSWIFIGRTDAKSSNSNLCPPDAKNCLTGKDPDAGKDWRWEKGMTEEEMVGWDNWLDGYEFEKTPGVDDGQGGLVSCSSWGHKESDTTKRLNWLLVLSYWKKGKVAQSCQTLCDPMDYTAHRILQARILAWVAFPRSRRSSQPRDQTQVSDTAGGFFTSWATREAQEYWSG